MSDNIIGTSKLPPPMKMKAGVDFPAPATSHPERLMAEVAATAEPEYFSPEKYELSEALIANAPAFQRLWDAADVLARNGFAGTDRHELRYAVQELRTLCERSSDE
jgi:hypothetical protein